MEGRGYQGEKEYPCFISNRKYILIKFMFVFKRERKKSKMLLFSFGIHLKYVLSMAVVGVEVKAEKFTYTIVCRLMNLVC